jgi:aryl-alcohol dehydrogenase-like predicted oxidoreductase
MRTIALPGTGLVSSRLGFGLSGLHHLPRSKERQRLLGGSLDRGITYFDAAPVYGHGLAERELGRFARGRRGQFLIATKFGIEPNPWLRRSRTLMVTRLAADAALRRLLPGRRFFVAPRLDYSSAAAVASLDRSLTALGTDHVDVLFVHDATLQAVPEPEALFDTLRSLQAAGKIRHFGLAGNARDCLDVLRRHPQSGCLLQINAARGSGPLEELNAAAIRFHSSFGHFRSRQEPMGALLAAAVAANREGVILFSTRRPAHVAAMTELVTSLEAA